MAKLDEVDVDLLAHMSAVGTEGAAVCPKGATAKTTCKLRIRWAQRPRGGGKAGSAQSTAAKTRRAADGTTAQVCKPLLNPPPPTPFPATARSPTRAQLMLRKQARPGAAVRAHNPPATSNAEGGGRPAPPPSYSGARLPPLATNFFFSSPPIRRGGDSSLLRRVAARVGGGAEKPLRNGRPGAGRRPLAAAIRPGSPRHKTHTHRKTRRRGGRAAAAPAPTSPPSPHSPNPSPLPAASRLSREGRTSDGASALAASCPCLRRLVNDPPRARHGATTTPASASTHLGRRPGTRAGPTRPAPWAAPAPSCPSPPRAGRARRCR